MWRINGNLKLLIELVSLRFRLQQYAWVTYTLEKESEFGLFWVSDATLDIVVRITIEILISKWLSDVYFIFPIDIHCILNRDGSIPVAYIQKYLKTKLDLTSEDEVTFHPSV